MNRLKILLVQPAPFEPGHPGLDRLMWLCEPLSLTSLAAMAPEHDVRILDLRLEEDTALDRALCDFQPDLVAAASGTGERHEARAVLRIAKETLGEDCLTVLVGDGSELAPEDPEDGSIDAACAGDPEEAFRELATQLASGGWPRRRGVIAGLGVLAEGGAHRATGPRASQADPDRLPPPARHLIAGYRKHYFFAVARPAAAMLTARGARPMRAETICDRMEIIPEDFVMLLEDDFLSSAPRLERLAAEIVRRDIRKRWGIWSRPEAIAERPAALRALRDAGLVLVAATYSARAEETLDLLQGGAAASRNRRAAGVLRALGIASAGVFTVRPGFLDTAFRQFGEHLRELGITLPIVRAAAAAPGPAPPLLLRGGLGGAGRAAWPGWERVTWELLRRRPAFVLRSLPGVVRLLA